MNEETRQLAVPTSVRARRKALGLTQAELADRAGVSTTAVHNLEAGKNGFTDKTLAALSKALGCRPADLLLPVEDSRQVITDRNEIHRFLSRIAGLTGNDVEFLMKNVASAIDFNSTEQRQSGSRDRSEPASSRHESGPSR